MLVNSIYTTFQGEANRFGIGSPSIFLRLQGCPFRCYKNTLKTLCDTPESLEKPDKEEDIDLIVGMVISEFNKTGVNVVTLTGGEPLYNKYADIKYLLSALIHFDFNINIETSGQLNWGKYTKIHNNISLIIDYKLKSAGLEKSKFFTDYNLKSLTENDYIKFVVYDDNDFSEMVDIVLKLKYKTSANIVVGAYWGGKLSSFDIFYKLRDNMLLNDVAMNFQVHKMAISSNYNKKIPKNV